MIAFTLAVDHHRFRSVDFSMPASVNQFSMMMPWPEEENKFSASIKPFEPKVRIFQKKFIKRAVSICFCGRFGGFSSALSLR